jgi:hypothetical protein
LLGAAFGALGPLALILVYHSLFGNPYVGLDVIVAVPIGALWGGWLAWWAVGAPGSVALRAAVAAVLVAAFVAAAIRPGMVPVRPDVELQVELQNTLIDAMADMVAAVLEQHGEGPRAAARAAQVRRALLVPPVLRALSLALVAATVVTAIGLGTRRGLRPRLIVYPAGAALVLVTRIVAAHVVVRAWPRPGIVCMAVSNFSWAGLLAWGIVVDAGQQFGASQFLSRHGKAVGIAAGVAILVTGAALWRPITAEYYYVRWFLLPDGGEPGSRYLQKAYRLCPDDERIAHAYAARVLYWRAWDLDDAGDHQGALDTALWAERIGPRDPSNFSHAGRLYRRAEQFPEAIEHYRKAIGVARQTTQAEARRLAIAHAPLSAYEQALVSVLLEEGGPESVAEAIGFLRNENADVVARTASELAEAGVIQAIGPLEQAGHAWADDEETAEAIRAALERLRAVQGGAHASRP